MVKKCDRCNKPYAFMEEGSYPKYAIEKFKNIHKKMTVGLEVILELCPDCEQQLDLWLNKKEDLK